METFADDIQGLEMLIHHNFLVFNLQINKSTGELKDGNVKKSTADYMNELSSDVKQQLYEIFKYDFILFDYDPDNV